MKKRILCLLLTVCCLLSLLPVTAAAAFAGGSGTESDPYLIATKYHLDNIRNDLDAHYKMIADIEFTDADFARGGDFYNNGTGWQPIGTDDTVSFTGTFDGNGHTITGLHINILSDDDCVYAGLFGHMGAGEIKNLGMVDSDIKISSSYDGCVGGVVGQAYYNTCITNCYHTGNITAKIISDDIPGLSVGGIAGWSYSTIKKCYNTGNITAELSSSSTRISEDGMSTGISAGGIVGLCSGYTISECYNSGTIFASVTSNRMDATCNVGGIAGCGREGTISNCYNTGSFTANAQSNIYAFATAGGIMGDAGGNCEETIRNCYSITSAESSVFEKDPNSYKNPSVGGIAGAGGPFFVSDNCYFLSGVIDLSYYTPGTALTDAQMKQQATYAGFDFDTVWTMDGNADYPYPELQAVEMIFEIGPGDINGDGEVNILDVMSIINIITGSMTPTESQEKAADFNSDGTVNILDAMALINDITGA